VMEPYAKTPPPPVLSPEVTATQALELLASVPAIEHVFHTENLWWNSINTTATSTKLESFNSVEQFFY